MTIPRGAAGRPANLVGMFERWLTAPQPILRLEIIRVLAPLAVLGFVSGRLRHVDELLGESGFHAPRLPPGDYRQPLYIAPLPDGLAWVVAAVVVASGLATAAGYRTRVASLTFAASLAFIALADRMAAFTVSKMSPIVMLALFLSPAGARYGVDAWRARRAGAVLPEEVSSGAVRFFQAFIVVMYFSSGWAKLAGEWLTNDHVLWTHVHDSYQTTFSWAFANAMPAVAWTLFQIVVAALEVGAPVWFSWSRSRPVALVVALGMHAMIGLMFGPVKWFALLMAAILLGGHLSEAWLARIARWLGRVAPGA